MNIEVLEEIQLNCVFVWGVAQTMFVGLWTASPWWRTYVGRAMFIKSLSIALLLDAEITAYLWPYAYSDEVKTVVIVLGMAASIWQLFAFVKQKSNEKTRKDHDGN